MATRILDPDALGQDEDWEGNNAAFRCPACWKVFVVSAMIHGGQRSCPACGKSTGHIKGTKTSGRAWIEWAEAN
jgi:hypothetical protein